MILLQTNGVQDIGCLFIKEEQLFSTFQYGDLCMILCGGWIMKYANQLTDNDLKQIYQLMTDSDAEIMELNIDRHESSISLNGFIKIPDGEDGFLEWVDDDYAIDDYSVDVCHHSDGDNCEITYRKFMLDKFGTDYAVDYLLADIT